MCDSPGDGESPIRRDGQHVARPKDVVLTIFPEEREFPRVAAAKDAKEQIAVSLRNDGGDVAPAADERASGLMPAAEEARQCALPPQEVNANVGEEYRISVERGSGGIGVDVLQQVGGGLVVTQVKPGPIASWNTAHPDTRVRKDDMIVEVNGVRGDGDQLIAAIKGATALEIVLTRGQESKDRGSAGEEFTISIQRPEGAGRLGVDIDPGQHSTSSCLLVLSIGAGPVLEWNANHPEMQVQLGDKIVEVNGGVGKEMMLSILRSAKQLDVTFRRGTAASVEQAKHAIRATSGRPTPVRGEARAEVKGAGAVAGWKQAVGSNEASDNGDDGGNGASKAAASTLQTGDSRWPFSGSGGSARAIRLTNATAPPCEAA